MPTTLPAGTSNDGQIGNQDSVKRPLSPSAGIGDQDAPEYALGEPLGHRSDRAGPEVEVEDQPDDLGLLGNDLDALLAWCLSVPENQLPACPTSPPTSRLDLVPRPFAADLPLELGEGKQHVQEQPARRAGGVDLLRDGDEAHTPLVEALHQPQEVSQRAG